MRVWPSMPKDLSAAVALRESPCRSDPVLLPLTNTRLLHQRKGDGKWTANSFRFWRSRFSWRHQAAPSRLRRSHRLRLSRLRLSRRLGLPTSLRLRGATHVSHRDRAVTQVAARRDLLGKGRSRTAAVELGESVTGQGPDNPLVLLRFRAAAGERGQVCLELVQSRRRFRLEARHHEKVPPSCIQGCFTPMHRRVRVD
jgi:hypothetical protein